MPRLSLSTLALAAVLAVPATARAVTPAEVAATYGAIGGAVFADTATAGAALQQAVEAFLAAPSAEGLAAARAAWKAARVPYLQTEVFRFGNPIVDDWEPHVNAWPLDEGLIDYVDRSYLGGDDNPAAALDVIANPQFSLSGHPIDASRIDAHLLRDVLHDAEGIEANVATGYHAIEFLLWGQDLNGTDAGAGDRPWTDYAPGEACTHGNCDRRGAYLEAATGLLVSDLQAMAANWAPGGAARARVTDDPAVGLSALVTGMGSLSYGELAGERIRLGLMLNDPEEEQDCFSDNTHNSHYYDGLGIQNVYLGHYTRIDGSVVTGPGLSALVAQTDQALDQSMQDGLAASVAALHHMVEVAEGGMPYDMMIAPGNAEGEAVIMAAVNALVDQTRVLERVIAALDIGGTRIEGSDSLGSTGGDFH